MNVVADSNFVIALAFEDDANHQKAVARWSKVETARLPVVAASEIAYFLLRNRQPLELLAEILDDEKIEVEASDHSDLAFALSKAKEVAQYDDFNDMLILGASKRLGLELATFDAELDERSRSLANGQ